MKKQLVTLTGVALLCGTLFACDNGGGYYVRNRDIGAVAGGVGGGVLGSAVSGGNTAATVVGAVGGAFVGYQVGKSTERRQNR